MSSFSLLSFCAPQLINAVAPSVNFRQFLLFLATDLHLKQRASLRETAQIWVGLGLREAEPGPDLGGALLGGLARADPNPNLGGNGKGLRGVLRLGIPVRAMDLHGAPNPEGDLELPL
ncbi:uncharacterized protein J3R85_000015 [Psidium guajava]|nr:uncharacterized protein J3R85_000015 [Psidium guajava]